MCTLYVRAFFFYSSSPFFQMLRGYINTLKDLILHPPGNVLRINREVTIPRIRIIKRDWKPVQATWIKGEKQYINLFYPCLMPLLTFTKAARNDPFSCRTARVLPLLLLFLLLLDGLMSGHSVPKKNDDILFSWKEVFLPARASVWRVQLKVWRCRTKPVPCARGQILNVRW